MSRDFHVLSLIITSTMAAGRVCLFAARHVRRYPLLSSRAVMFTGKRGHTTYRHLDIKLLLESVLTEPVSSLHLILISKLTKNNVWSVLIAMLVLLFFRSGGLV